MLLRAVVLFALVCMVFVWSSVLLVAEGAELAKLSTDSVMRLPPVNSLTLPARFP